MTKVNKAILKIAYAISAMDGVITDSELAVFRKIAQVFPDFDAGGKETNEMFLEAIALGDQIVALRKVYDDDELLKAVVELTKEDYEEIVIASGATVLGIVHSVLRQSRGLSENPEEYGLHIIRRAFVMWLAIALADGEVKDITHKFIKQLQDRQGGMGDELLEEAEQTIKMMTDVQAKMKGASVAEAVVLQKAYDELEGSLKDLIFGK